MIIERFPDRTIQVDGKHYLYFGGTAYLGLQANRDFQEIIGRSLKKWGSFYGSSRNANIQLSIFNKAEELFSDWIKSEDCVAVSSGTLAGKLVLEKLSKLGATFYHYPKTHPAILHNESHPLFVNGELHPNLLNNISEKVVIAADAILASEVKPTSFEFLNDISSQKTITLVIDESHSLGIVGMHGEGIFNTIPNNKLARKIMISSLGKAMGLSGGIIASDKAFIESIKNETLFVSSSCANPAYLEAFVQSQDLIKAQQRKLKENLGLLFKDLKLSNYFKWNREYPVIYCEYDIIYSDFLKNDIVITSFKYPTYKHSMNRIVVTANHTASDIVKLIQVLNEVHV